MVIVGGWFEVDPDDRDAFIAQRIAAMRRSRAEHGCVEYVIAPDPVERGRAVLYERWESQADLDAHAAGMAQAPPPEGPVVTPTAMSIKVYDVTGERPLA